MELCAKCGQRKGKRSCPALGGRLCPPCCGTLRLEEIRCLPDCTYLGGEERREERRSQRISAAVTLYRRERATTFSNDNERYVAYTFEGAAYEWWSKRRELSSEAIAASFERAGRLLGTVTLPGDEDDTLARLLANVALESAPFKALNPPPRRELFIKILRRLGEFARDHEKRTAPLSGYFDGLRAIFEHIRVFNGPIENFLPNDRGRASGQASRTPGGLIILPGS
jgi:hypothetical protein